MDGGATDNLGLKGLDQTMERLELCGESSGQSRTTEPCKRLVLVVDAQNGFKGRDPSAPDPRGLLGRFVDMNFLDAYDTLMQTGYGQLLRSFRRDVEEPGGGQNDGAVLHLALMTFIRDDWLGYDGQYGSLRKCPEGPPVHPDGSGTDRFAFERACALEKEARGQLADEDRATLRDKLSRINTDWRITPDEVACLEAAAYALVAAARPELQEFLGGDKVLRPQDAARFDRSKSKCFASPEASS